MGAPDVRDLRDDIGTILLQELSADLARSRSSARPLMVGITGSVGVGKSTAASALRSRLEGAGKSVAVLSTDAFLLPNDQLRSAGLDTRKGFPETFNVEALRRTLKRLVEGRRAVTPVYEHQIYDLVPGEERVLEPGDVVVVDGLHLGRFGRDLLDVLVYLEADEGAIGRWFADRLVQLVAAAAEDRAQGRDSFYARFAVASEDDLRKLAGVLWAELNLVNLREYIVADRDVAEVVVTFDDDHRVASVERR